MIQNSIINSVWDIAEQFIQKPQYVYINNKKIEKIALQLKEELPQCKKAFLGYPGSIMKMPSEVQNQVLILYELLAGAINYNYWYGRSDIRPNDAGASKMYQLLDEIFEETNILHLNQVDILREQIISKFIIELTLSRFPNLEKRIKHLTEINNELQNTKDNNSFVTDLADDIDNKDIKIEEWLKKLIITFPGYASDIFLKRAFLFFMQLDRRIGCFEENEINKLPIPADYQIPKMLHWLECLVYMPDVQTKILQNGLISSGSLMECEIRAASIIACKKIAEQANCSMMDVDAYLWINRNNCCDPFHLTITSDY